MAIPLLCASFVCTWFAWRGSGLTFALAAAVVIFSQTDLRDFLYLHRLGYASWSDGVLPIAPAAVCVASIGLWGIRMLEKRVDRGQSPNKAPQPTTTAVTAPANVSKPE